MHHDTNEYALQFDVICLFWLGNYINSIHSCSNIHPTNKLHSPDETAVALWADAASSGECNYRSVPQIRPPPPFCNLSLSRKRKGGLIRGMTFSLAITPSLPVPRPHKLKLDREGFATAKAATLSKYSTGLSFQQTVLLTPLANTLAIDREMFSGSVDAGFVLALPFHHGDLEPDRVGVSTRSRHLCEDSK